MALYFFDLVEGQSDILDEEGSEHPDLAAARRHAILSARSILSDQVRGGVFSLAGRIAVRDEYGASIIVVPFADAIRVEASHEMHGQRQDAR